MAFAYDWRLSCRFNAARLGAVVDEELGRWRASAPARRDARAVLLCHSMGGLVARYWAECLGGHEVVRRIVTLGTPHRGSLDALETLVNGHGVGPRPVRAAITRLARSLPSVHQLTPDYACLDSPAGCSTHGSCRPRCRGPTPPCCWTRAPSTPGYATRPAPAPAAPTRPWCRSPGCSSRPRPPRPSTAAASG
ncbi:esterase/lipase family protein [Streptomyces zhihengii]